MMTTQLFHSPMMSHMQCKSSVKPFSDVLEPHKGRCREDRTFSFELSKSNSFSAAHAHISNVSPQAVTALTAGGSFVLQL